MICALCRKGARCGVNSDEGVSSITVILVTSSVAAAEASQISNSVAAIICLLTHFLQAHVKISLSLLEVKSTVKILLPP